MIMDGSLRQTTNSIHLFWIENLVKIIKIPFWKLHPPEETIKASFPCTRIALSVFHIALQSSL